MDLRVTKNIQFTRLIKAPAQQREFNFRRIPNADVETFHVDVSDERMNRIMFQMRKESGGQWKISSTALPEWIANVENKLHEILEYETPGFNVITPVAE
ncbi:MAG TPA: hypothetical protein VF145_07030 [Chitinophagaceae bacterium]